MLSLEINMSKTKYLYVGSESEQVSNLQIQHMRALEKVKYRGGIISSKETPNRDIANRISQGQKCVRILNSLLWLK